MKATEQYFSLVLFIMLYKMVLTFESVDEILKCDHTNEKCFSSGFFGASRLTCNVVLKDVLDISLVSSSEFAQLHTYSYNAYGSITYKMKATITLLKQFNF